MSDWAAIAALTVLYVLGTAALVLAIAIITLAVPFRAAECDDPQMECMCKECLHG